MTLKENPGCCPLAGVRYVHLCATLIACAASIGCAGRSTGAPQPRVPVAVTPPGRKPFVSFNIPTLHYIEDDARFDALPHQRLPDDFEIHDALETIRFLGGTVVRMYTLSVRKPTDPPNVIRHVVGARQFNEEAFVALDRVLAAAAELGVQVILPFVDNWPHWGGITEYAAFRGKQRSDFFTDDQLIADFEATIDKVLSRRNTINGRAYRDDPTIYAWETGNELIRPDAWAARIAHYIKQRDPNHALIDGINGPTIREASLTNPDIDIVSSHHYGAVRRNIELVDQNVRKIAGRKRYLIGECGLWSAADTARMLEHVQALPVEGTLLWGMRGHTREGGFYHHMERLPFQSYHLTGSDSGASYGEREILGMVRRLAFEARGLPMPPASAPPAPFMLGATSRGVVTFRGALGARDYVIERQIAPEGPWERVADHFDETAVAYRPFVDPAPPIGQTVRYRVTAFSDTGASPPSPPSAETLIEGRLLVDEMERAGAGPRTEMGATVTTDHPERCKMDWSRLAGKAGARVEYRPQGRPTALRVYAFTESRSGQVFDVAWSADGKEFTRLATSEDAFLLPGDAPETRRPVRITAATIPPQARALAITYLIPAEIGRVEIDWLPTALE
jgi:mannan endo-1,4-beta-mannosidase